MGIGVINLDGGVRSSIPGITISNVYVHNTGFGAYQVLGPVAGTDPGGYPNQVVIRDDSWSPNGGSIIYSTIRWVGGHNCLQIHGDTGAKLLLGNTVGPGCPHSGGIDTKGAGTSVQPVVIQQNNITCGCSANPSLCAPRQSGLYNENTNNPEEGQTIINNRVTDCPVGAQSWSGQGGSFMCKYAGGCNVAQTFSGNVFQSNTAAPGSNAGLIFGGFDSTNSHLTATVDSTNQINPSLKVFGGNITIH